jgi:ParB-like chromosome segregation protein Spo0J
MAPAWWDETTRFVDALENTQHDLFDALRRQRRALALGDHAELERLNAQAADAASKLQQLSVWRTRLLQQAVSEGGPATSLLVVLGRQFSLVSETLRARLQTVQLRFAELRREAWIQWVISHRGQSVYADLVDLIARGGQKAAVYGEDPHTPPRGGVMLDAAA